MADVALEVRDLCFGYGDIPVWEDVSFSLESGQVAFLTGPNGAGKSTLFRCLAGWLEPDEGEVLLDGEARVREVAQMLSGSDITEAAINNAKELLNMK